MQAIILVKDLNTHTIAEGIENYEQLPILLELDCQYYQGFYLHIPFRLKKRKHY